MHGYGAASCAKGPSLIAGIGNTDDEYSRYLAMDGDKLILWTGKDSSLFGSGVFGSGKMGICWEQRLMEQSLRFMRMESGWPQGNWIWVA